MLSSHVLVVFYSTLFQVTLKLWLPRSNRLLWLLWLLWLAYLSLESLPIMLPTFSLNRRETLGVPRLLVGSHLPLASIEQ